MSDRPRTQDEASALADIVAQISAQMLDLQVQVAQLAQTVTIERAIILALLAQHGDPTHISVARAAELEGVSEKTIRRRITAGRYTLERRPGEKESGIPIEQFYAGWTPIGALRSAIEQEKTAGGGRLAKEKRAS